MLQYRDFKEFKDGFNYNIIKNYIRDCIEPEIRHLESMPLIDDEAANRTAHEVQRANEITILKHIAKVLQSLIDLKASC
jgi:hypothetical protein